MSLVRGAGPAVAVPLLALAVLAPRPAAADIGRAAGAPRAITIAACAPGAMEPAEAPESCGGETAAAMFTGLVEYVPGTATTREAVASAITTKDNRVFTVRLRKGWLFHDGTEVKAANFVRAWSHAAGVSPDGSYYFRDIAGFGGPSRGGVLSGLKVLDDRTFTITLTRPSGGFVALLARPAFAPLPDSFFADPARYHKTPVGDGPYRFVSRSGGDVTLQRFDAYGGPALPRPERVVFRAFPDWDQAFLALRRGEIDYTPSLPHARWDHVVNTPFPGVHVLNFPLGRPEVAGNAPFRRALSMAIPRRRIVREFGAERAPADGFVPPPATGARPGTCGPACAYDPAGARAALAEARAAGFTPPRTFTIYYNSDALQRKWAAGAAAAATRAFRGRLTVVARSGPPFDAMVRRADAGGLAGAFRWAWLLDAPHASDVLATYRSGSPDNHTGYADRRFDALLDAADRTPAPGAAARLYHRAEKLLVRDMPAIPLFFYRNAAGYSQRLSGVRTTPFGGLDLYSVRV
ncbi:peptide ABC transporter substrate-binding protein [Sphaerisporangium krabiense]|uniref:Oligopeptide transport system substrate-binding protein n=1 Tax=Sphaerisporangium krabiense TaxID=763782 RepID=A0A7W8Z780_9ACTN|nr:ABC transporter substrate-binding protein [Sphaerisporangium krabiense]MBB5628348.1 oligopeptide transport system substrate-binding protein [Sphaerisporangium krabiense]GII66347.1 peptide ABC transporter substrate-binding protein [Sphaerisporangium krabiense]